MNRAREVEVQCDAHGSAAGNVERGGRLELATRNEEGDVGAVVPDAIHRIHDEAELRILPGGRAVQRQELREIPEGHEIDVRRGQREVDPTAVVPCVRAMDLDVGEHDVQLLPLGRASRTYTESVPEVTEPKNASPAMRSKPVTAMANTVRGFVGSSSPTIIRGEGYIDSRDFPRPITRASRDGEWREGADRSVDAVDRFSR